MTAPPSAWLRVADEDDEYVVLRTHGIDETERRYVARVAPSGVLLVKLTETRPRQTVALPTVESSGTVAPLAAGTVAEWVVAVVLLVALVHF